MMKKALILLSAVLLTFTSFAAPVKKADAEKMASLSFKGAKVTFVWDGLSTATARLSSKQEPNFYVFNSEKGGFIIIAADDAVNPVIAYSKTGSFKTEGMPENVKEWMGLVSNAVEYARGKGLKATAAISKSWNNVRTNGYEINEDESKVIETALWDQGSPFYNDCPKFGMGQTVTGCVATATAIMMKHRKFPSAGTGTIPSYTYTGADKESHTVPAHDLGHTYDWENMPMKITMATTAEQKKQISTLMYDLGTAVKMQYGTSASSAFTEDVPSVLVKYMGYDKSMIFKQKNYMADADWYAIVKKEIDTNGPTVFSGSDPEKGGHAFVVDGYSRTGTDYFFHFNWGWSGSGNGFFSINSLSVDDFVFSQGNIVLLGAIPDKGGEKKYVIVVENFEAPVATVRAGQAFRANFSFYNQSVWNFSGSVGVGVVSASGDITVLKSMSVDNVRKNAGYVVSEFPCNPYTAAIKPGDRLTVVFKENSATKYEEADMNPDHPAISLMGIDLFEQILSMEYDKSTSRITVSAIGEVPTYTLKNSGGSKVTSGVSVSAGVLTIDYASLAAGEYTLSIVLGDLEKVVKIKK